MFMRVSTERCISNREWHRPSMKDTAYLSKSLATKSSWVLLGGGESIGSRRGNPWGGGLSMEYDRCIKPVSPTSFGLPLYSAKENLEAIGEAFAGKGFRRTGEGTGMEEVCARKAANDWTAMFARDDGF